MSRGRYAGQPHTFRCSRCKVSRAAVGSRITTTGRVRKQEGEGMNYHHWPDVAVEYRCRDCSHTGWSRHPDVHRIFLNEHGRSTVEVARGSA